MGADFWRVKCLCDALQRELTDILVELDAVADARLTYILSVSARLRRAGTTDIEASSGAQIASAGADVEEGHPGFEIQMFKHVCVDARRRNVEGTGIAGLGLPCTVFVSVVLAFIFGKESSSVHQSESDQVASVCLLGNRLPENQFHLLRSDTVALDEIVHQLVVVAT